MFAVFESPIGNILLSFEGNLLIGLSFLDGAAPKNNSPLCPAAAQCILELTEYFCGARQSFTVQTALHGTSFQQSVWAALRQIPFGETRSYKDIAAAIGNPTAARAVGLANNRNPVSIIVPCHRVIGSNKKLVGYGGGVWRKEWLLAHEKQPF